MKVIKSLSKDVRISSIDNGQSGASVIFSTCSTEGNIVSSVENDFSFGNGSIVLEFSLSDGGTVVAQND